MNGKPRICSTDARSWSLKSVPFWFEYLSLNFGRVVVKVRGLGWILVIVPHVWPTPHEMPTYSDGKQPWAWVTKDQQIWWLMINIYAQKTTWICLPYVHTFCSRKYLENTYVHTHIYILQKIYTHQCITCIYIKKCIHISFIISHLVCQIWECKRRNQRSLQNHPWKSSCDAFNVQVTKCPDWKVGGGKLSADNSWRFVFEKISRL